MDAADTGKNQEVVDTDDEDETVLDALQQDLEPLLVPLLVGNVIDPIAPTVVDSCGPHQQRENCFSPLTAEIEEEPLSVVFLVPPEPFVLRPTVGESDTGSLENPSILEGSLKLTSTMWAGMQAVNPSQRCVSLPRVDWGSRVRISSICGTQSGSEPI